jgi:hypothetical protein
MPVTYKLNGKAVTRKEFLRGNRRSMKQFLAGGGRVACTAWSQPLMSHGLSVHPSQAKDMAEKCKDIPGVEVRPNGDVLLHSRKARAEALRRCGYHDRDGGYRD